MAVYLNTLDYLTIFHGGNFNLTRLVTKGLWTLSVNLRLRQISIKEGCLCSVKRCLGRRKPYSVTFFMTLEKSLNLFVPVFCLVNVCLFTGWIAAGKIRSCCINHVCEVRVGQFYLSGSFTFANKLWTLAYQSSPQNSNRNYIHKHLHLILSHCPCGCCLPSENKDGLYKPYMVREWFQKASHHKPIC